MFAAALEGIPDTIPPPQLLAPSLDPLSRSDHSGPSPQATDAANVGGALLEADLASVLQNGVALVTDSCFCTYPC